MQYEIIFTILNRGFSDLVMDAAREQGAKGGTILTARGTAAKKLEQSFGFTVSQEKEIIMILSTKEERNAIMTAICKSAGLNTQGKGITFSLPVDEVLGVSLGINNKQTPLTEPTPESEPTAEKAVEPSASASETLPTDTPNDKKE